MFGDNLEVSGEAGRGQYDHQIEHHQAIAKLALNLPNESERRYHLIRNRVRSRLSRSDSNSNV